MNNFCGTLADFFHHLLRKYINVAYRFTLTIPSIIGFTLAIMMLNKNSKVCGHNCSIIQPLDGHFQANCSTRNLEDVPQDLDENIEDLDLSYNHIINLTDDIFQRYKRLKKLTFSHNTFVPETPEDDPETVLYSTNCFSNVPELLTLDISYTYFGNDISFLWPSTLQVLRVEDSYLKSLNLSELQNLKELHARGNDLRKFPDFNLLTPLTDLDLRGNNNVSIIQPEWISPYCLLTFFAFEFTHDYHKEEHYCTCERLRRWLLKLLITGPHRFHCVKPASLNCDPNITPLMWADYNKCVGRHPKGYMKTIVVLVSVFAIIVFSICVMIFVTKSQGEDDEDYYDFEEEGEEEFYEEDIIPPVKDPYKRMESPGGSDLNKSPVRAKSERTKSERTKSQLTQSKRGSSEKKESEIKSSSYDIDGDEEEYDEGILIQTFKTNP